MAEPSKNRIGSYERLQLLGAGGQGRVFKAVCLEPNDSHIGPGVVVAIKILHRLVTDDEAITRQQRQTEVLRTLVHRNIVRYFDCFFKREGEWDEALCLVMELLDGDDLKTILKEKPAGLPWAQVRDIMEQCLEGLLYARNKGVYHRDIKPSNIIILADGTVKLIDFGIAHIDDSGPTTTGDFKGTFDYMAPDFVLVPHLKNFEVCDVFSLGVCIYQALTGDLPFPPFAGNASIGYVTRWQNPKPPEPSFRAKVFRVYPQARSFLRKALAQRQEDRFHSFADMLDAWRAIRPRTIRHQDGDTYECEAWIGRGGFGEVFRARRTSDGRIVAVKYLASTQNSPQRFIKEARLLQGFHHPHIVEYLDFLQLDRPDGSRDYFLILEFLDGMPGFTLRERVKKAPNGLPVDEVLVLFDGYLDALHQLHAGHGRDVIIHRDIKPGNLYAPEGAPEKGKVFDLGVARDVQGTATAGTIPGTLDYMPPEFASGDDRGTPQSDIYSLGLCLYEALTGRPLFPPLPPAEKAAWPIFIGRSREPPRTDFSAPVFRDCPPLVGLVRRALEQKPRRRFASAKAMREELQQARVFLSPVPEPEPESEPEPVPVQSVAVPEPETRMGEATVATIGVDLASRAAAGPPPTRGTVSATRGVGTVTVAPTAGTVAKTGLVDRLEKYKTQRTRRKILGWLTSTAALVILCAGVVYITPRIMQTLKERQQAQERRRDDSQLREIDTWLTQQPPPEPNSAYVRTLISNLKWAGNLSQRRPADAPAAETRANLQQLIQALPSEFSNRFEKALGANNLNTAGYIRTEIRGVLDVPGLPVDSRSNLVSLAAWIDHQWLLSQSERLAKEAKSVDSLKAFEKLADEYQVFPLAMAPDIRKPLEEALWGRFDILMREAQRRAIESFASTRDIERWSSARMDFDAWVDFGRNKPWSQPQAIDRYVQEIEDRKTEAQANLAASELKKLQEIDAARKAYQQMADDLASTANHVDLVAKASNLVAKSGQYSVPRASDPGVEQAYAQAVLSGRAALAKAITNRFSFTDRSERLKTIAELLKDGQAAAEMLDPERTLRQTLQNEQKIFMLGVHNVSGQEVGVLIPGSDIPGTIQAKAKVVLPITQFASQVVFKAVAPGYVPQTNIVVMTKGGGSELTVREFDKTPVSVSWADPENLANPPVSATWTSTGQTWQTWEKQRSTNLPPAHYTVRFTRPDYVAIETNIVVPMAMIEHSITCPAGRTWVPQPQLMQLIQLRQLKNSGKWEEMAALRKEAPKFDWPAHAAEFKALQTDYDEQVAEKLKADLEKAESAVRDYCASIYQIEDPFSRAGYRRDLIKAPNLSIRGEQLPEGSGSAELQGQYRRILAWQAAGDLTNPDNRTNLANNLRELGSRSNAAAPETASRCMLESKLLAGTPPLWNEISSQNETRRWRAHIEFRPDYDLAQDTLKLLAEYIDNGGVPNQYDIRLGCATAAICLDIISYQVKESSRISEGKFSYTDRDKAQKEAREDKKPVVKDILTNLKALIGKADDIPDLAAYLEAKAGTPAAALMIRFLGERGDLVGLGVDARSMINTIQLAPDKDLQDKWKQLDQMLQ